MIPPHSRLGTLDPAARKQLLAESPIAGQYERALDRVSAFELLQDEAADQARREAAETRQTQAARRQKPTRKSTAASPLERMARSAATSIGRQVAQELMRGFSAP